MQKLSPSPQSAIQRAHLLPFGAWLFDLLENIGIVSMPTLFPARLAQLSALTGLFSTLKWVFALTSVLALVVGLTGLVVKSLRKGQKL